MKTLIAAAMFMVGLAASGQQTWYVSTSRVDVGAGAKAAPFRTIQAGIDAAAAGDEVVVLPGVYTGEGNRNLDFDGKAITVRSQYPSDPDCVAATVIDAQGRGIVARFVNDETSETIFEGFTLRAGDVSAGVRGVPGFFEFSQAARPTTRHISVEAGEAPADFAEAFSEAVAGSGPDVSGSPSRIWDSLNPFHQPANTTDFYGSGDVNRDGQLTSADSLMVQQMSMGLMDATAPADVYPDGFVNDADVQALENAIAGSTTPSSWWNNLTDRAQRNFWLTTILSRDKTDQHPYLNGKFVCLQFAVQTHFNVAHYRDDLYHSYYTGGQTAFNVPMYVVSITASQFGHAINATLVGDDPLNFEDWRFTEPQNDMTVSPGVGLMPYNSTVSISKLNPVMYGGGGYSGGRLITFKIDGSGNWTLDTYDPSLVLTRPSIPSTPVNNSIDKWNPHVIPAGSGMIAFDRYRDDLSRVTDIHLVDLPFSESSIAEPLTLSPYYSRIQDVCRAPDGSVYLLWTGKPGYDNGLFVGRLDPATRQLVDVERVTSGLWKIPVARLAITATGAKHVFWACCYDSSLGAGVQWTKRSASGWTPLENLTPDLSYMPQNDSLKYSFDVAVNSDDEVILVWDHWYAASLEQGIRWRKYDGAWSAGDIVESTSSCLHMSAVSDAQGITHLVYEKDGSIYHRSLSGSSWSAASEIDDCSTSDCSFPRVAAGRDGEIRVAWMKNGNVAHKKYENALWGTAEELQPIGGTTAYYPEVEVLNNGTVAIAWSARSDSLSTIQVETIAPPDSDGDGMPDAWELQYGLNPNNASDAGADADSDGMTNLEEFQAGTVPDDSDSDNDLIPDGWEVANGLNPLNASDAVSDPDTDGLTNLEEYQRGTDPNNGDTDNDGMPDGWEVDNSLDPNDASDASGNPDGDAYTNLEEYQNGTDPNIYDGLDSDYDWMTVAGTFNSWDEAASNMTLVASHMWRFEVDLSDESNVRFKFVAEGNWGFNWGENNQTAFTVPIGGFAEQGYYGDILLDGTLDGRYRFTLNEQTGAYTVEKVAQQDTDGDGMPDSWETANSLDPNDASDASENPDGDLYTNLEEYRNGTDPHVYDRPSSNYDSMTLAGTFNDWDEDLDNMDLVDHYTWQWEGNLINETAVRFKFVANSSWSINWGEANQSDQSVPMSDYAEGGDQGDILVSHTLDGQYRVTFNEDSLLYTVEEITAPDTDGDGMPDDWEDLYGLDKTDSSDASNDEDADGLTNLQEYEASTNPLRCDTDFDGILDGEDDDPTNSAFTQVRLSPDLMGSIANSVSGQPSFSWRPGSCYWIDYYGHKDKGYVRFDVAGIPDGAAIQNVVLLYQMTAQQNQKPLTRIVGLDDLDPSTGGGAEAVFSAVATNTALQIPFTNEFPLAGEEKAIGFDQAVADNLKSRLTSDSWALGFGYENSPGDPASLLSMTVVVSYATTEYESDYDAITVAGTFNNWDQTLSNMQLIADYIWQYDHTFNNEANVRFKFTANGSWSINWGENDQWNFNPPLSGTCEQTGSDILMFSTLNGTYRFTFNERTREFSFQEVGGGAGVDWIGETHHWPGNGNITDQDDFGVYVQSHPIGEGVNAQVDYTTDDGATWLSEPMSVIGQAGANDEWEGILGPFSAGTVVKYQVQVADTEGTVRTDDNDGAFFTAIVNGTGDPLAWIGNAYHWPWNGEIDSWDDVWVNIESYPQGAAISARVHYNIGNGWQVAVMNLGDPVGNNDHWYVTLGVFNSGTHVEYAIEVIDGSGASWWDSDYGNNHHAWVN
ncbi:MAG: hypothetical protein KJ626_05260 [Verrucomicrobia bacterium]|nr:hypothetical protein [Verrucomicrobiota bacterium]